MAIVPIAKNTSSREEKHASEVIPGDAFTTAGEWAISFHATGSILALLLITTSDLRHWFVIPLYLCGSLIGTDVIRVLRGKVDVFDPQSLVAIVGYHMFFLAPLLHVRWDYWLPFVVQPSDWRPWLGQFGWLNAGGLLLYLVTKRWFLGLGPSRQSPWIYRLKWNQFSTFLAFLLMTTFTLQVAIYASLGGFSGYIAAFESGTAFRGMGALFFFSESFPMLAFMGFVAWMVRRQTSAGWPTIALALILFVALRMIFGGLRGSRTNLIWSAFWALGMVHLCLRPIQKRVLGLLAIIAIVFMYIYGFYKSIGADVFSLLLQPGGFEVLNEATGRTFEVVLLGDLGRADVQAFLIHQLSPEGLRLPFSPPMGETYLSALLVPFPTSLVPVDFVSKVDVGTYVLQGGSTAILGEQKESRVYGLAGEALLNFGLWVVPVAYAVFGMVVAWSSRWSSSILVGDSRLLIAPFVSVLAFYPLIWDADNVVVFALQFGVIPSLLVLMSSKRTTVSIQNTRSNGG